MKSVCTCLVNLNFFDVFKPILHYREFTWPSSKVRIWPPDHNSCSSLCYFHQNFWPRRNSLNVLYPTWSFLFPRVMNYTWVPMLILWTALSLAAQFPFILTLGLIFSLFYTMLLEISLSPKTPQSLSYPGKCSLDSAFPTSHWLSMIFSFLSQFLTSLTYTYRSHLFTVLPSAFALSTSINCSH